MPGLSARKGRTAEYLKKVIMRITYGGAGVPA